MSEQKTYHMSPADFRRHGRAVVDWIADYYEQIEALPVLSQVRPGQIRAGLPPHPPLDGEAFEDILQDVTNLILP
jgi:aromatic-L-amino-acid decarboxylase